MLLPIENGMTLNNDWFFDHMFLDPTPWDYRDLWELIGFAREYDLITDIVNCETDECDDPEAYFNSLTTKQAAKLIEDYIERYGLIGDFCKWKEDN